MTVARSVRRGLLVGGKTLLFFDTFNRSDRLLNGDNGWIVFESTGIGIVSSEATRFSGTGASSAYQDFGITDYRIEANLRCAVDGSNFGQLLIRTDGVSSPLSFWQLFCFGGDVFLREVVSGTVGVTLSTPFAVAPGSFFDVTIADDGLNIGAKVSQGATTATINTSNSSLSGNTKVGMRIVGVGNVGIDDFKFFG